jgi:hypothetical protein
MQNIRNAFDPKYVGRGDFFDIPGHIQKVIQLPYYLFMSCFIIGTILMLCSVFTHKDEVMMVTMLFTVIAFWINLIALVFLIICSFWYKDYTLIILQKTSLLLINIPIAFFYLLLILHSFNF